MKIPAMRAARARSLSTVRKFWMRAPQRTPTALAAVRTATSPTAMALNSGPPLARPRWTTLARYSAEIMDSAAMLAALMMVRLVQPKRKAGSLPKDSRRYTYCPPAWGKRADISAKARDPIRARRPEAAQQIRIHPGEGRLAATFWGF